MFATYGFEPLTSSAASFPREWWKVDNAFEERHFRLPLDSEEHSQASFRAPLLSFLIHGKRILRSI